MELSEQLAKLLGLGPTAEWPHSEKSLVELIELQKQKEVTKQEYYKLESKNKSIELMNYSLQAGIPSFLIPMVFSGETISDDVVQRLIASQQQQPQQPSSSSSSIPSRNTPGQTSPTRQLYTAYQDHPHQQQSHPQQQQPPPHQNPIQRPPQNLGPPVSLHSKPLSPAKIGAAAVAQLDRGRYPSSPVHKRYQSMPTNSPSLNSTPAPVVVVNSPSIQGIPRHQQSMMGVLNTDLQPVINSRSDSHNDSSGGLQFINENPGSGRKRSRNSEELKHNHSISEFSIEEESSNEHENKENLKKIFRRKGHQRTRSENYLLDKQMIQTNTPTHPSRNNSNDGNNDEDLVETNNNKGNDNDTKDQEQKSQTSRSETPKGPKFANNILSSA